MMTEEEMMLYTRKYVEAGQALQELHKWIRNLTTGEFEANTDPKLMVRHYASVVRDIELETDALETRLRAERGWRRELKRSAAPALDLDLFGPSQPPVSNGPPTRR
jgi:hypothetical protein